MTTSLFTTCQETKKPSYNLVDNCKLLVIYRNAQQSSEAIANELADFLAIAIVENFVIRQNIRPMLSCTTQLIKKQYELFLFNTTYISSFKEKVFPDQIHLKMISMDKAYCGHKTLDMKILNKYPWIFNGPLNFFSNPL